MPKVALILSSGRTGTRFLARYLDANFSGVTARHEPAPGYRLRLASNAHLAGRLSRASLRALLRRARSRSLRAVATPLYVESNPFLFGFVDVFDEVFEEPVVLHVVRDPRDYVRSSLNHGSWRGLKGLANRVVPYWYPDVRRLLPADRHLDALERTAGFWALVNRSLHAGRERCARYHLFRYEDLFDADHSGLRELCRVLDLAYPGRDAAVGPDDRINASRLELLPPWREWPAARCARLQRICAPWMAAYGYGLEPEWLARVEEARAQTLATDG